MKSRKLLIVCLALVLVASLFATVACGHTHNYSKWGKNATEHWKYCPDDNKIDESTRATHVYGANDKCVCGAEKPAAAPHECGDVCPICNKCLTDCGEPECAEKCAKDHEDITEYTIHFSVGTDGTLVNSEEATLTTVNGQLTKLPEVTTIGDHTEFLGWFTEETDGDEITLSTVFSTEDESTDITVYAQYHKEYVITLHLDTNKGHYAETPESETFVTVDGKIEGSLPNVISDVAHWTFTDWYDDETAGAAIDETEKVFTADTDLYARFARDNGVWVGDEFVAALIKNGGAGTAGGLKAEYWFGAGNKVRFEKDAVLNMWIGGNKITNIWVEGTGVQTSSGSTKYTDITVTESAKFEVYLKDYSSGSPNWTCTFTSYAAIAQASKSEFEQFDDCAKITIQFGSDEVYFYLIDTTGAAVGAEDIGNYRLYTYPERNGNWQQVASKPLTETYTMSGAMPDKFIFRWGTFDAQGNGGYQTKDLVNIEAGCHYLVQLAANASDIYEITDAADAAEAE